MIDYSPFWNTLKEKGIKPYHLIKNHGIAPKTLQRMRNNTPISVRTLDDLCQILDCEVQDIIKIHKDSQA